MTSEEIKYTYSMEDVIARYGFHSNRAHYICCPFHHEKTPSMRIYKDSYYCFGCQAAGDIFSFVEKMEDVSFKEAFMILGGEYPDYTDEEAHKKHQEFLKQKRMQEKTRNRKRKKPKVLKSKILRKIDRLREEMIPDGPYITDGDIVVFPDDYCERIKKEETYMIELESIINEMEEVRPWN